MICDVFVYLPLVLLKSLQLKSILSKTKEKSNISWCFPFDFVKMSDFCCYFCPIYIQKKPGGTLQKRWQSTRQNSPFVSSKPLKSVQCLLSVMPFFSYFAHWKFAFLQSNFCSILFLFAIQIFPLWTISRASLESSFAIGKIPLFPLSNWSKYSYGKINWPILVNFRL